ncbi:hypothetical protein ACFQ3P_38595 [Paraburkholderia sabiae]|uniref:Uncharacterized protein n=1 Tax=Paraburkholderia sabiae TaxID=273251 RepID=A0ABU9QQM2_9BURK|nr:hypothetical protein [Paraburkholderia sabiae]WJZ74379.1 hypothetical protein QEN71_00760 [Paraburkholderia sabiae]CAD6562659.1 hypothetical protein LMG24235_07898 [Paraburkholderia sabiae]
MKRILLCLLAMTATLANAQSPQSPDLVALTAHVNPVMDPDSLGETAMQCIHNTVCKTALDAAALYLGVDISTLTTTTGYVVGYTIVGEDADFQYPLPEDYEYCSSVVHTVSVVPATGDRASQMQMWAIGDGMRIHTWTPKRHFSEGHSWIDAQLTVIGVNKNVAAQYRAAGKCSPTAKHFIGVCRGSDGVNHGEPACKTIVDPRPHT